MGTEAHPYGTIHPMKLSIFFTGRRLLATILVIAGAVALCGLGYWQAGRFQQRTQLNERINARMAMPVVPLDGIVDPQEFDYRRVEVRGVYDPSREILLRNRSYNGATGYHLITPLRLNGSNRAVLVDRGWIPFTEATPQARRAFAPPVGEVVLQGVARRAQERTGGPVDNARAGQWLDAWFRVDIPQIEPQIGYSLLPVFIELQPGLTPPGAPPIPSATSDLGPGSHLSYAIQWFSFAIILLVGYVAFTLRQLREITLDRQKGRPRATIGRQDGE